MYGELYQEQGLKQRPEMGHKPNKAARHKAKLKAERVQAKQFRHQQHVRIVAVRDAEPDRVFS